MEILTKTMSMATWKREFVDVDSRLGYEEGLVVIIKENLVDTTQVDGYKGTRGSVLCCVDKIALFTPPKECNI